MPLTVRDGALVGFGMLFAGGATIFYRRKQTLPFKVSRPSFASRHQRLQCMMQETYVYAMQLAYFAAWPTLGTAVLFAAMPRNDRLVAVSWTWPFAQVRHALQPVFRFSVLIHSMTSDSGLYYLHACSGYEKTWASQR